MVELVLVEIEASDQGADGTGPRGQGNESTFYLGQLGRLPGFFGV